MLKLEEQDHEDRTNGTPKLQRLRQIPPETGKFLAIMLANSPEGTSIEIGTSAGYSTLWLALACRATGKRIITIEVLDDKVKLAKETFQKSKVNDVVDLVHGDARHLIHEYSGISFCFLDCEKEYYVECYEAVIPNLVKGGILIAHNATSHESELAQFVKEAYSDERVDTILVPYEKGVLVCRKK